MAIALADILDERHIALQLKSRRQANALGEIIGLFEKTGSVQQATDFLAQVLARERVNSTLAENGVAFPRARTALVDQIALAVGRSRAGIPWNDKGERAHFAFCRGRSATIGERLSCPGRQVGPDHPERPAAASLARRSDPGGIHRDLAQRSLTLILSTNDHAHDQASDAHSASGCQYRTSQFCREWDRPTRRCHLPRDVPERV